MSVCSIMPVGSISKNFMSEIHIPVGFVLKSAADYKNYLTIDQNTMRISVTSELRASTITVKEATTGEAALTMQCESKVNVIRAAGSLYYNGIVKGFQPAAYLGITDVTSEPTAFSGSNTIPINEIIAYSCFECLMPDNIISGFDILVQEEEQFVIDTLGSKIPYNPLTPGDFIEALQDPSTSQTIFIPYTITLTPIMI